MARIESLGAAPAAEPMRWASPIIQSTSLSDHLTAFHQGLSNYYHTCTYRLTTDVDWTNGNTISAHRRTPIYPRSTQSCHPLGNLATTAHTMPTSHLLWRNKRLGYMWPRQRGNIRHESSNSRGIRSYSATYTSTKAPRLQRRLESSSRASAKYH